MGANNYTYSERIRLLAEEKRRQTKEKQEVIGIMDYDDWAVILPPKDRREIKRTISGSGVAINDCILTGVDIISNHPGGGFFGPGACGRNFRALLDAHPPYIDPMSSLAGGYMANFTSYRDVQWNPDFDCSELDKQYKKYGVFSLIGGTQHFCQDLKIGLEKGWKGILASIEKYRHLNGPECAEFYDGLENSVLGIMDWIRRHAQAAEDMKNTVTDLQIRSNLEEMAEINRHIAENPPRTFREACQWILWYQMSARMYNGSGSLGKLDVLLDPYYVRESGAGTLTDEEAMFHIACMLLRDTSYIQLGGPDADRKDVTGRLSFLILEAAHQLKIPANIGVAVGEEVDPGLARRGVEILFEDKTGIPKFLGVDNTLKGYMKNGFSLEDARSRAYSGCHWLALPGREYAMMDIIRINFAAIFDIAFHEMMYDRKAMPSLENLWKHFEKHVVIAVRTVAEGIDFHTEHMQDVFPELLLDLLSYGPVEKGFDASNGSLDYYTFGIDGSGLATAADSFASIRLRIEDEKRITWDDLLKHIDNNWEGPDGELARLMMKDSPRFGGGNTLGDKFAVDISTMFSKIVKQNKTRKGYDMIPGLFSWVEHIGMGKITGATPNGRRTGDPISHGANPHPGFRKDGAITSMAKSVAAVQPGYGNTAPLQMDIDPMISKEKGGVEIILGLIKSHFLLGGTQININVLDKQKVLEANENPALHPDLIVRVTGFSAYFASLSPEFRNQVVQRIIEGT